MTRPWLCLIALIAAEAAADDRPLSEAHWGTSLSAQPGAQSPPPGAPGGSQLKQAMLVSAGGTVTNRIDHLELRTTFGLFGVLQDGAVRGLTNWNYFGPEIEWAVRGYVFERVAIGGALRGGLGPVVSSLGGAAATASLTAFVGAQAEPLIVVLGSEQQIELALVANVCGAVGYWFAGVGLAVSFTSR